VSDADKPLKGRMLRAGRWVAGGYAVAMFLRLASNLILTRLLLPEAFGLMAVVYVLMTGLAMFSDMGLRPSIIQNRRGAESNFLNTVWSVQIFQGVLIWLTVLLIVYILQKAIDTGWFSANSVYADPMLPSILTAFSFMALIQGFTSTKLPLAERNLQLKRITQLQLMGQFFAMVVTIVWAALSASVWALVGGALASQILRTILSHVWFHGPTNRFQLDNGCFKEIFHFGKWVFLLSIIGFLSSSGDRMMLASMVDPTTLGIYAIAFLLFSTAQSFSGSILSRVVFPALRDVSANNPKNIFKVSSRIQLLLDLFLFGVAGLLFSAGDSIVSLLYDQRYHDAGPMLGVLGIGLIGTRHLVTEQWWLSKAAMRPLFWSNILRFIVLLVGIPMGFMFMGMDGSLVAIAASFYAGWPIALCDRLRNGLVDWKYEFIGVPVFAVSVLLGIGLSWLV